MDRFGLGTSFLPAEVGQLLPTGCCPSGSHHVLWKGAGFPSTPRVVMPQTFTPCSLGVSNSCCQNLGLQGRVPIEGHQVITRQEHRRTVASFDLKTPLCWLLCLHLVLAMQEFRLSVARLCSREAQLQVFVSSFPSLHKPNDLPAADRSPAVTSRPAVEGTGSLTPS